VGIPVASLVATAEEFTMQQIGTVEAVNLERRLAVLQLSGGKRAVVEWLGRAAGMSEGDVVRGYLDSFGSEYLEDATQRRLVKANVRFLGCSRNVALELIGTPVDHSH
jgi:hypothetical protein